MVWRRQAHIGVGATAGPQVMHLPAEQLLGAESDDVAVLQRVERNAQTPPASVVLDEPVTNKLLEGVK
jgi:hypothetical protein